MRGRKAAAFLAAVFAVVCLNGCAYKKDSGNLAFLEKLWQSEDWQDDLSSHFRIYPLNDEEQLIGKDIYIETLQEAYNTETLANFLDRVQQGKPAEMDYLSVGFDTSYFWYIAYDGTAFYLFADGSQNHVVGKENWYYEKTYQYLCTNPREERCYIYTDYFFSNEPQQETDGKNRTGVLFWTREEKLPEDILPAYDPDTEKIWDSLKKEGRYQESDCDQCETLRIENGRAENPEVWDAFYEQVEDNRTCQLNIQEKAINGQKSFKWLHYEGEGYWQGSGNLAAFFEYKTENPEEDETDDWPFWIEQDDLIYVFEQDGHVKVGIGSDFYELIEQDFGEKIRPVTEFDR